ncbi:WYL domain-containing protein [Paenibacillus sp. VCA1]|uniref:helix-turn-helix transcriptional regulator n=1 Tax=Paenibacillus sp. VCA1 TaxID=3039148 RepID=UPI00287214E5|nr:WYL domain-containing protein [Paenibacillus sp. VCA1]MDR9856762.1 WYL domain-containing protein [Paenibacillus sp. VCA1]
MTDRLIRLMRIITLVQAKPGILARELAERCSTTERTIYRDMEALSAMHIPITHLGYGKGYRFIGSFALYPFDWTAEEVQAFTALGKAMPQVKPLLPDGFEGAYEKVMAAHNKQRTEHLETELQERENPWIKWAEKAEAEEQSEYLIPILLATLSQQIIQAEYYVPERNELLFGKIDPYILVPWQHRFYLVGRNHNTGKLYTYRLKYFARVVVLDDVFIKVHTNMQQENHQHFRGNEEKEPVEFKIRLTPAAIPKYKEKESINPLAQTKDRDGSVVMDVTVEDVPCFMSWLSQFGADAEIIEPEHYRDVMKRELIKWLAVYS